MAQRTGEVQSDLTSRGSESGRTETFGTANSDRQKFENPKMDSQQFSVNLPTTVDDLELIDIDSLFDDEADDKPVLSKDEAWELFS